LRVEVFEWAGEFLFGVSTAIVGADFVFTGEQCGVRGSHDVPSSSLSSMIGAVMGVSV
jgi:hypothetical protein